MQHKTFLPILACAALSALGCADEGTQEMPFSSDQATLLEMEFDGELVVSSVWDMERTIEDQLLYTIGHLNGDRAVGRLDNLELSNVERSELPDGKTLVSYHAKLPVGWGSKTNLPQSYSFKLPKNVDYADYEKFVEKYSHDCVDWGAHDVDTGSMWYYYRPNRSGCRIDEADVLTTTATVKVSEENTTGKYPEYDLVWKDEALRVVAIFGKYEDGATTASDAGVSAYNSFVAEMKRKLTPHNLTTVPASVPSSPGVETPDVAFSAALPDGRRVEVVALLVDNVRTAPRSFDERYASISASADLIFYNGHAGLGSNVRALAQKGKFVAGQYQIFFMNGCDTFAYVDGALSQRIAALNPDDPNGTRYLDMVTNVMPSYFHSMPYASMALVDGLMSYAAPKTYEQIFTSIDRSEVVVVTGEEDNAFQPGVDPGDSDWEGLEASGSLATDETMAYDLGELEPGQYLVTLAADPTAPGGDIDLYVASGRVPTLEDWDHRPYLSGSDEAVTVTVERRTHVHVMVHGYDAGAYVLKAEALSR